jgi:hypothetical protein
MLEESVWEQSSFVTLTYNEEKMPEDWSVKPDILQRYIKRVRKKCEPFRIRFYGVGEYGDPNECSRGLGRPHYHIALFGVGNELRFCDKLKKVRAFSVDNVVEDSWKHGFVHVGYINKNSARYISNYVTKFMNFEKSRLLKGRSPEFARMSNRPGIGAPAMVQLAEELIEQGYSKKTIVGELYYGNKNLPLGEYLTKKLHKSRGGDPSAEFREGRARLIDMGIEYIGWSDSERVQKHYKNKAYDCIGGSVDGDQRDSVRNFRLSKRKGTRFKIEASRRQFRQRRSI